MVRFQLPPVCYTLNLIRESALIPGVIDEMRENDLIEEEELRYNSLVTQMKEIAQKNTPSLILIDNFREGLDFDRANKLANYLFEKSNELGIQIITASNDRFLMNSIDIEHWNILKRKGSQVKAYNYQNSKEVFDNFNFTGLSNFDFFAMDFVKEEI